MGGGLAKGFTNKGLTKGLTKGFTKDSQKDSQRTHKGPKKGYTKGFKKESKRFQDFEIDLMGPILRLGEKRRRASHAKFVFGEACTSLSAASGGEPATTFELGEAATTTRRREQRQASELGKADTSTWRRERPQASHDIRTRRSSRQHSATRASTS